MMRQGGGRTVNVTTSLGTMFNAGSPTYGPSKAALEALSAIMAKDLDGTGVTVNVLVPGGVTNTPMISDEAGFDRARLIQPGGYGVTAAVACLRCRRHNDGPTVFPCSLGYGVAARRNGRAGCGATSTDQRFDQGRN